MSSSTQFDVSRHVQAAVILGKFSCQILVHSFVTQECCSSDLLLHESILALQSVSSLASNMASGPRIGDKMIVVKEPWTSEILNGTKTMELRSQPIKGRVYFLADSSTHTVRAKLLFGQSEYLSQKDYNSARDEHRVQQERTGLHLNIVRLFENACSCSVFCSVFESERVRLNVFGLSERLFGVHCL